MQSVRAVAWQQYSSEIFIDKTRITSDFTFDNNIQLSQWLFNRYLPSLWTVKPIIMKFYECQPAITA